MKVRFSRLLALAIGFGGVCIFAEVSGKLSASDPIATAPQIRPLHLDILSPQGPQMVPTSGKVHANGTAENGGVCATNVQVIIYSVPPSTVPEQPDTGSVSATISGTCAWTHSEVGTAGCNNEGTWANECVAWGKYPGDSEYSEWTSSLFRGMCASGLAPAAADADLVFTEPRGKRALVRVAAAGDQVGRVRAAGTAENSLGLRAVKGKVYVPNGTDRLVIPLTPPDDAVDGTVHTTGNRTRWVINDLPGAKCNNRLPIPRSFVVVWYQTRRDTDFRRWVGSGFGGLRIDP